MSPFEIKILRFIFNLDNILLMLMPWLKVLVATAAFVPIAILVRRIIRGKIRLAKR